MLCCIQDRGHILAFGEYSDILAECVVLLTCLLANAPSLHNLMIESRTSYSECLYAAPMIARGLAGNVYGSEVCKSLRHEY